jgi:hypothetical protein
MAKGVSHPHRNRTTKRHNRRMHTVWQLLMTL